MHVRGRAFVGAAVLLALEILIVFALLPKDRGEGANPGENLGRGLRLNSLQMAPSKRLTIKAWLSLADIPF
jgi:hypothetical protein